MKEERKVEIIKFDELPLEIRENLKPIPCPGCGKPMDYGDIIVWRYYKQNVPVEYVIPCYCGKTPNCGWIGPYVSDVTIEKALQKAYDRAMIRAVLPEPPKED